MGSLNKRIISVDHLRAQRQMNAHVDGEDVVLLMIDDVVTAFENRCPHQQSAVLHLGEMKDGCITCPMHGWTFDLRTGRNTNGNGRLHRRSVHIEEGQVFLDIEEDQRIFSEF